ncbi:hypothetical protein ACRQ5D_00790 [Mucilaginibacter sp. P25]|uniref:Uncharacterized protein n=1 Tax=Mucilaginibacter gossypii TaxID=551996 RepID=A0A1G8L349_9SPHI|nr:hypothetical protein [Mucilaginibacter gossypii]SDI50086.1 hypothetical protein SAMN05192573_12224 [Mucilaginibacter gossypii]
MDIEAKIGDFVDFYADSESMDVKRGLIYSINEKEDLYEIIADYEDGGTELIFINEVDIFELYKSYKVDKIDTIKNLYNDSKIIAILIPLHRTILKSPNSFKYYEEYSLTEKEIFLFPENSDEGNYIMNNQSQNKTIAASKYCYEHVKLGNEDHIVCSYINP